MRRQNKKMVRRKKQSLNKGMIFHTIMKDTIKSLFFEETLKRWHFNEIAEKTTTSR